MKVELIKSRHSVGESNFHYQLTPAYRKNAFADDKMQKLVRAYFLAKADELNVLISALEFGPDHVHIFVANCRKYAPSQLVGMLKGFVSRMMRKNHRKLFNHLLWGDKFWTEGYFYRSIGAVTADAVKYYIEKSQAKHWEVVDYDVYQHKEQKKLIDF